MDFMCVHVFVSGSVKKHKSIIEGDSEEIQHQNKLFLELDLNIASIV